MSLERLIHEDTENIRSNTIEYALDDPLSRTASYILNIPSKVLLLSTKVGALPREETQHYIQQYLQKSNLENTTVRVGHTRILRDLYRLVSDKKLKDISLAGRLLLGIPYTLIGGLISKLTRSDMYNPFTKTANIYSDVPAIALHELGHAQDYQNKGYPTLYSLARYLTPAMLYQEYKASAIADKALPEEKKWQTGRYLVPAFGTYIYEPLQTLAKIPFIPFMLGAHIIGNTYSAIRGTYNYLKEKLFSPATA